MKAKARSPRKTASSLSKREKIRRYPFKRQKRRSISFALLVQGAVVAPGIDAIGFRRNDGDHAELEHQLPGFITLVSAIHQQRIPGGTGGRSRSNSRPSGASCAWPGDRANVMAVRASAATDESLCSILRASPS